MPKRVIKHLKRSKVIAKILKRASKQIVYSHPYIYYLNMKNRIRYGPSAPKVIEKIWVNPQNVTMYLCSKFVKNKFGDPKKEASGKVVESSWPTEYAKPIAEAPKIKACIDHWFYGIPWEETGIYDYMLNRIIQYRHKGRKYTDGCVNMQDIIKRYEALDLIFEEVKREGKLEIINEIKTKDYGVIHIGPGGDLFFGGGSYHRFAIAYILHMPFQAVIGLVHVSAVPYLDRFRKIGRTNGFAE